VPTNLISTTPPRADEQCFSEATRDESPAAHSVIGVATLAQYRDKQRGASTSSSSSSVTASTQPFLGDEIPSAGGLGIASSSSALMGSPTSDGLGKRLLEQPGLQDNGVGGHLSDSDDDIGGGIGGGGGGNVSDDEWVPKQLRKGMNSKASRRRVAPDAGSWRGGQARQRANSRDVDAAATSLGSGGGGRGSGSRSSTGSSSGSGTMQGDVAIGTGAGGVSGLTLFSAGDPAAIVRQLRHAFARVQVVHSCTLTLRIHGASPATSSH